VDREFLLLLLVFGVLLNTGLLVTVAALRVARVRDDPAPDVPSPAAIPQQTLPARPVSAAARRTRSATSAAAMTVARPPAPATAAPEPGPSPAATAPAPVPAPTAVAAPAVNTAPVATPAAQPARTPAKRSSRPRRFTLPRHEEDHRTTHSIAAFLGEPVAPTPGAHPQRRRHRARRPAGANVRSDVLLVVVGDTDGGRGAHAVAAALRDTVRASDEVVELPGGRLRVTLDADASGADAFVVRAQAVVRPWLALLGPAAEMRVERDRPAAQATPAAS
jgi:hypothetical protein